MDKKTIFMFDVLREALDWAIENQGDWCPCSTNVNLPSYCLHPERPEQEIPDPIYDRYVSLQNQQVQLCYRKCGRECRKEIAMAEGVKRWKEKQVEGTEAPAVL